MKIIAVFHGPKVEGLIDQQAAVAANPTLSIVGMEKMQSNLLPKLNELGPFNALYSSRMARALDTASVIAMALDMDFQTISGLGQKGNLDSGQVIAYPGYENDDVIEWQRSGFEAILKIANLHHHDDVVIAVSHRPIIAGLVAITRGVKTADGINSILSDPSLTKDGFIIFDYDGTNLRII